MESESYRKLVTTHWKNFAARLSGAGSSINLNGNELTIADVVYVARYGGSVRLDASQLSSIRKSAQTLKESIERGEIIYGVNTGYGGSADTRTTNIVSLQHSLLRTLQVGIISNDQVEQQKTKVCQGYYDLTSVLITEAKSLSHQSNYHDMAPSWVRAMMAIRANSLASGISGIDVSTLQILIDLISADIIPQIPLRGSISASGDLSPLSYVAGVMQGNQALRAYVNGVLLPAGEALMAKNCHPVTLGPKEGLAIVNGTAASAAVGCLAIHEMLQLTALSQILTAMSVEALLGTDESFDPFIAKVRPHPGQIDAAANIRAFLSGSRLVDRDRSGSHTLRQDRYSLRTSTQWIGPSLEDLQLCYNQVTIELNSVTDNPLIDSEHHRHLHGGNFQARSITSAMEKVRQSCQVIGKMLFAQCTELINPVFNRGLPPNLAVDEPSNSFLFKGLDILVASLSSELGYLASPVNHVETAEMGNQALNSLALISGRYTLEAIETLTQLTAAHLSAVCQALDLRVMNILWFGKLMPILRRLVQTVTEEGCLMNGDRQSLNALVLTSFCKALDSATTMDSSDRIRVATDCVVSVFLNAGVQFTSEQLRIHTTKFNEHARTLFIETREAYVQHPDATPFLGSASKRIYRFVRERLGIPFTNERGLEERRSCFGTAILSPIFAAIRDGALWPVLMECLSDVEQKELKTSLARARI